MYPSARSVRHQSILCGVLGKARPHSSAPGATASVSCCTSGTASGQLVISNYFLTMIKPNSTSPRTRIVSVISEKPLTKKLSKVNTSYQGTENKGEWLPMSVWVSRGWNEAEILSTATSKNTKPHPRWGTVYQVCVEADIDGNLEKQTKTKEFIADQREQAKDGRRAKVAVAAQVEPVVDENALRKAREQAEKDERALEKKAQQDIAKRARDEEKIKRATLALAAKTYAKLSGVRDSLGEELKGNVSLLPEWAVTQAKATKASADSKLAESQKVVAKKLNLLSFGVDDVQDTYMATVEATRLLAGLKKCCKKK